MSDHDHSGPTLEAREAEIHPVARKFLWLASPRVKNRFMWFTVAGLIVTAALMLAYPNKHPAPWEQGIWYILTYGVIGAGAYTIVVLSAAPLFKLLSRDENYYGEEIEPTGDDHV